MAAATLKHATATATATLSASDKEAAAKVGLIPQHASQVGGGAYLSMPHKWGGPIPQHASQVGGGPYLSMPYKWGGAHTSACLTSGGGATPQHASLTSTPPSALTLLPPPCRLLQTGDRATAWPAQAAAAAAAVAAAARGQPPRLAVAADWAPGLRDHGIPTPPLLASSYNCTAVARAPAAAVARVSAAAVARAPAAAVARAPAAAVARAPAVAVPQEGGGRRRGVC